jgi:hypothetical protein
MRNGVRIVPVHTDGLIKFGDDYFLSGEMIDISLSRAFIRLTPKRPAVGQTVNVGRRKARVVRLINNGIVVQFDTAFSAEDFGPNVIL